MTHMPIPAGALMTITTGEYSDYIVHGVFRAIKEIRLDDLLADWVAEFPEQSADYGFKPHQFMGRMAAMGLIECVESYEMHLGDYGRISEVQVQKSDE